MKGNERMKKENINKRALTVILSTIMVLGTANIAWAGNVSGNEGSYPLTSTEITSGWKQDDAGWWYQNLDGSYTKSAWRRVGDQYYYFNENGYMLYNTTTPDGYQVGADGARLKNEQNYSYPPKWTWVQDDIGWRYQTDYKSGYYHKNGWMEIDDKLYYFNEDGYMLSNTVTPDGCTVDENGVWVKPKEEERKVEIPESKEYIGEVPYCEYVPGFGYIEIGPLGYPGHVFTGGLLID